MGAAAAVEDLTVDLVGGIDERLLGSGVSPNRCCNNEWIRDTAPRTASTHGLRRSRPWVA